MMNRDSAVEDIVGHFLQDALDGVLRLGEVDDRLYRSCVAEYGYGKLADDAGVREAVVAGIESRTFSPAVSESAPVVKPDYDERDIRCIYALFEKKADIEVFQYDVILSILSEQIAPLIIGSGNIMTLFAYHAVRKLVEDMRNNKLQAQEMSKPTSAEEDTSYPILDAPTYSSKRTAEDVEAVLTNDQLEEVGEGLAECAHERWMEREKAKGNTDDPNLVPYNELSEVDKESDRDYPYAFMNLLEENGFDIVPKESALDPEHEDIEKRFETTEHCPTCGQPIDIDNIAYDPATQGFTGFCPVHGWVVVSKLESNMR